MQRPVQFDTFEGDDEGVEAEMIDAVLELVVVLVLVSGRALALVTPLCVEGLVVVPDVVDTPAAPISPNAYM